MSLRHALLALLTSQPMSGYNLAKVFDRSVAYVWHAPYSQIYPELRRMEVEGLVAVEIVPRGKRAKRIYSISQEGREELNRWIEAPSEIPMPHNGQLLRSAYLEFGSYAAARRHFSAHRDHYEVWERRWTVHADQIAGRETALIQARLAAPGTGNPEAAVAYKVHAYRGLAAQARHELEWATEGLRLVDELEAAENASSDAERAESGNVPASAPTRK